MHPLFLILGLYFIGIMAASEDYGVQDDTRWRRGAQCRALCMDEVRNTKLQHLKNIHAYLVG